MFSFLQSTPAPEMEPENTPDSTSSMFGGLEVKNDDSQPLSSFGFINAESTPIQSSFSFMQPDSDKSTGFSFMSPDETSNFNVTTEQTSSFSFMVPNNMNDEAETKGIDPLDKGESSLLSLHFPTPSRGTEEDSSDQAQELIDFKLNKASLVKTVKKKKKSSKVGFGRDDEDDSEDKQSQQSHLHQIPQSQFSILKEGVNAISSIEVDIVHEVNARASEGPLPVLELNHQLLSNPRIDLPATPPPPLPSYPASFLPAPHPPAEDPVLASDSSSPSKDQEVHLDPTKPTHSTTSIVQLDPPIALAVVDDLPAQDSAVALKTAPAPLLVPPAISPKAAVCTQTSTSTDIPVVTSSSPMESSVQKLERKSREIQQQLMRALSDLSRTHQSALAGQERFQTEIESEMNIIETTKSRIVAAEEEQSRLAAEEDFEKADALNELIQSSAADMHAREVALGDLRTSVRLLEETFSHERAECVNNFLRATNALRITREQLAVALTQQHSSSQRQWDLEDARIRAELERIGLEKDHFEREELALAGDADRTEDAIRTQTGDLSLRKSDLEASMSALNEEIRLLQEQLSLKLSAQEALAADLNMVDGKIGEVRKKYDRQLQRISDRQSALQSSKVECLEEENVVLEEQRVLEAQAAQITQTKSVAAAWAASLEVDIDIADVLLSQLMVSNGGLPSSQLASISSIGATLDDDSAVQLQRKLETITHLLGTKRNLNAELQTQRNELVGESRRLADLLPTYEAEKKAHAAAKRFKEAAAAAKELKEIQAAKELIDNNIDDIDANSASTVAEIVRLEEEEKCASAALLDARRKGDIARFEYLLTRGAEVRSMQQLVASKLRNFGDTSLEGIGPNVLSFLSVELEAVQKEALGLKELHALPQDVTFTNDLEVNAQSCGGALDLSDTSPELANSADGRDEIPTEDTPARDSNMDEIPSELGEQQQCRSSGTSHSSDSSDVPTTHPIAAETEEHSNETDAADLRGMRMLQAQDLLRGVASLSAQLDEASENEEYELAAELFEKVTSHNEQLSKILDELNCSREDIEQYSDSSV